MKNFLVTMIGLEQDRAFIPHWIKHYAQYPFEEIQVFLQHNDPGLGQQYFEEVLPLFDGHDQFKVKFVTDPVDYTRPGTKAKIDLFTAYLDSLPEGAWLYFADADELIEYIHFSNEDHTYLDPYVWQHGYFVDHFSSKPKIIEADPSLWEQFPFIDSYSSNTRMIPEKIIAIKKTTETMPINFEGCHNLRGGGDVYKYPCAPHDTKIHHFKWHIQTPRDRYYVPKITIVPTRSKSADESVFNYCRVKVAKLHFLGLFDCSDSQIDFNEWQKIHAQIECESYTFLIFHHDHSIIFDQYPNSKYFTYSNRPKYRDTLQAFKEIILKDGRSKLITATEKNDFIPSKKCLAMVRAYAFDGAVMDKEAIGYFPLSAATKFCNLNSKRSNLVQFFRQGVANGVV